MKTGILCARLSVLSLALSAAFSSFAQSQSDSQGTLPEVVVTATRNPQLLSSTLAHTTVISREDIENSQATDVLTLLQREAGLQRVQSGGTGTVSTIFMRGLPALDTLILIDGVPQNKQDATGTVSLEHIMLDNVERVEVVRGNVSAIYGSGAIGGVIQIFTRTASKEPHVRLAMEVGPRATAKVSSNASMRVEDTSIQLGVSRYTSDGFSAVNAEQFATANPDTDGYQNVSANFSVNHSFSKNHRLGIQVMQAEGQSAYDNYFGASVDQQSSITRLNQTTLFSDNTWGIWHSRLSVSEQSERGTYFDNGTYGSTFGAVTKVSVVNWVNTLPLGDNGLATMGLEQQRQHIDTYSTDPYATPYDKVRMADAVFAGLEGSIGASTWQLNLRNDRVGDLTKSTSYLGFGYAFTTELKAIASTSTAFKAPPLGYLYDVAYGGNPLLKPEIGQSHEVGMQYAQGRNLLRAIYFDTHVQDQLAYQNSQFLNINETRNTGVELSYRGSLGSTDFNASYTEQNPIDVQTGQVLLRRAKTMLSVGVSKAFGGWRADANMRYSASRSDRYSDPATFASVETKLPAYTVLDVATSYQLSSQWLFTARLDNVTDEKYQTVYGYNQQPRSLYAGVTWTPKF